MKEPLSLQEKTVLQMLEGRSEMSGYPVVSHCRYFVSKSDRAAFHIEQDCSELRSRIVVGCCVRHANRILEMRGEERSDWGRVESFRLVGSKLA